MSCSGVAITKAQRARVIFCCFSQGLVSVGRLPYYIENAEQIAGMLKALAHPVRLCIFAILATGPQNVTSMTKRLGLPQCSVSQHLRILQAGGLLKSEREGTFVRYALINQNLTELVDYLEQCCNPNLGANAQGDKL